ncbi:MAG: peptide ABC transporter substrate-binding protein [Gemmatimonadota bacterium]
MPQLLPLTFRRPARIASLFLACAVFSACKDKKGPDTVAVPPAPGGTIVIATSTDASTMLPPLVSGIVDRQVTDLLYDRLADIGQNLNTVGDKDFTAQLAERWEWATDSLSIVFFINPHAMWHDGQPVRASDVRFSVKLMKDPSLGSPATALLVNVDSVSVRDSVTAVAWFKRHTPEQFYDLVYQVPILPEHILSNTPVAQLKTAEVGRRGIGSGRFRLDKWEPGQRIVLVSDNFNYRGRAKIDRVIFAISPDFNAASTRFFAGDADLFENLRVEQLPEIAKDTGKKTQRLPSLSYNYLAMNMIDPKNPGQPHPIFGDRAVRRALTMAVDRRAMLKNVFDTIGQLAYGPFPHSMTVADTTLPQIPYDTAKARALLDSAGWVAGPDGIRSKLGRRLAFSITTPSSSAARHSYAILLQEAFRKVGADVKLDESDFAGYLTRLTSHTFDTEMANFSTDPSVSGFQQSWSTRFIGKDGQNHYSYSNPRVDAMLDSATVAFDPARSKLYARHAFEAIMDDAPGIWLYEPPTIAGVHKRIRMVKLRADAYFSGLADWWIPSNERIQRDVIGVGPTP